ILTNATIILTPLLYKYNESFGGIYINVKSNLVFINTIDFSKVPEIKSSPILQEFIHLLNFKPANYSTYQLESTLNSLSELMDSTNPVNIVMGISPVYNLIVIDVSHNDDKVNEAFLNATLQFEHFIFLNYVNDSDDSLTLRSTFDSSSSRLHTKRLIEFYFEGGEGIVTSNNSQPVLSCSAGFSAINVLTLQKFLITSAR
ncbi:41514_t:CDS:1, partial [Gigaspora margarita]